MLMGKSILHVNQDVGKFFQTNCIKGYYNNMVEKVRMEDYYLESDEMPFIKTESGSKFEFPVAIFQYAFGLLDLYYESSEEKYLQKFKQCADWAIDKQLTTGAWDNFSYYYPNNPYGAMAQGEGVSLLVRAYMLFEECGYLEAAKKGIDFMLLSYLEGGCTKYIGEDVIFLEYPHKDVVMNGWIFAWWGLYDYTIIDDKAEYYRGILNKSLKSLIKYLPQFKCKYWSMYSLDGKIASPFYHNLHIAQMQAMYMLTEENIFKEYADRWAIQQKNSVYKTLAFVKKAYQKIRE